MRDHWLAFVIASVNQKVIGRAMNSRKTFYQIINQKLNQHLYQLGWSPFFQEQLRDIDKKAYPARVIGVRKNCFLVRQGDTQKLVTLAGSLLNDPAGRYPAVGDWVLLRDSIIFSILARQNVLTRKASGGKSRKNNELAIQEQIIAVNVDKVFIVCGLDRDFNLRRLERYVTMVYNCSLTPEIVLTKADLQENPTQYVGEVELVAFGIPVHLVAQGDDEGISGLRSNLAVGQTAALIGSSGAGKSTLINRLYGKDVRVTACVSKSLGKGKHTTTSRDLISLPTGGMLIDNPGIREIALAEGAATSLSAFPEIEELSHSCRFDDCTHTHEPGCKVTEAVSLGLLTPQRLQSFHKIQNELKYTTERKTKSAARIEKEQWKAVSQKIKCIKKTKKR